MSDRQAKSLLTVLNSLVTLPGPRLASLSAYPPSYCRITSESQDKCLDWTVVHDLRHVNCSVAIIIGRPHVADKQHRQRKTQIDTYYVLAQPKDDGQPTPRINVGSTDWNGLNW